MAHYGAIGENKIIRSAIEWFFADASNYISASLSVTCQFQHLAYYIKVKSQEIKNNIQL